MKRYGGNLIASCQNGDGHDVLHCFGFLRAPDNSPRMINTHAGQGYHHLQRGHIITKCIR